jgi:hypothetical protein
MDRWLFSARRPAGKARRQETKPPDPKGPLDVSHGPGNGRDETLVVDLHSDLQANFLKVPLVPEPVSWADSESGSITVSHVGLEQAIEIMRSAAQCGGCRSRQGRPRLGSPAAGDTSRQPWRRTRGVGWEPTALAEGQAVAAGLQVASFWPPRRAWCNVEN